MTFAPVVGSSWGDPAAGEAWWRESSQLLPAWVSSFAAEVQAALLEPDFVKPRVSSFLLIFVYKTPGSHASPQHLLPGFSVAHPASSLGGHCAYDSLADSPHSLGHIAVDEG